MSASCFCGEIRKISTFRLKMASYLELCLNLKLAIKMFLQPINFLLMYCIIYLKSLDMIWKFRSWFIFITFPSIIKQNTPQPPYFITLLLKSKAKPCKLNNRVVFKQYELSHDIVACLNHALPMKCNKNSMGVNITLAFCKVLIIHITYVKFGSYWLTIRKNDVYNFINEILKI